MPHVTQAMRRSGKAGNLLLDALLGRRSVTGEISNVKDSFSSWDNCMNATYCKWPVIIIIIVVSLVLLSIITCIVRCACCGMSCCCSCFSFLKCCDCCGDSCEGKKNKPKKFVDDPYAPPPPLPHQGYQPPAPMMGGALPSRPEPPKYASFEVGKSGLYVDPKPALSEDALPPMPSWDSATKKHVVDEEEKNGVELGHLDPATGQSMPLMTGGARSANNNTPTPNEMRSPYGQQPGQAISGNGYAGVPKDSYFPPNAAGGFNGNGGYRGSPSPGPGRGGRGAGYGPRSPRNMNAQDRGYAPSPQDGYGNDQSIGAAISWNGYRPPQRQFSNGPGRQFPPQPSRQYSDSSRPLNPGRQYTDQSYDSQPQPQTHDDYPPNNPPPRGPSRGPTPHRTQSPALPPANAGFDFGTGAQQQQPQPYPSSRPTPPPQQNPYTSARRPSQPTRQGSRDDYGSRRDNSAPQRQEYATYDGARSPPPQPQPAAETAAYPGYKPYTPPVRVPARGNDGSPAPAVLTPGGGRGPLGREPAEGWDPVR